MKNSLGPFIASFSGLILYRSSFKGVALVCRVPWTEAGD